MAEARLIFLDIDGVLNSIAWKMARPYHSIPGYEYQAGKTTTAYLLGELDLSAIAIFEELLRDTKAEIVISSSWRLLHPGVSWLKEIFHLRGARLIPDRITGRTPNLNSLEVSNQRGKEIVEYLANESFTGKYICIDDCSLPYLANQPLIETNPAIGFSVTDYQDALELFNLPTYL